MGVAGLSSAVKLELACASTTSLLDVFYDGSFEDIDDRILLRLILDWYGQSSRKEERPTDEETDAVVHSSSAQIDSRPRTLR